MVLPTSPGPGGLNNISSSTTSTINSGSNQSIQIWLCICVSSTISIIMIMILRPRVFKSTSLFTPGYFPPPGCSGATCPHYSLDSTPAVSPDPTPVVSNPRSFFSPKPRSFLPGVPKPGHHFHRYYLTRFGGGVGVGYTLYRAYPMHQESCKLPG